MAQVALAWLADRPTVTSVILGARTTDSSRTTSAPPACTSPDEETEQLDAASDPAPADYPYGGPGVEQRGRQIAGGR